MSSVAITNPTSDPLGFETSFTQAACAVVNTPRALCVSLLVTSKEWDQLLSLELDSRNYQDAGNFADDYLITNILTKSCNLPLEVDRKAEAIRQFFTAEALCKLTNDRILGASHPEWWHVFQKRLADILGPIDAAVKVLPDLIANGSGASIGVKGDGMVSSDKFDMPLSITKSLVPFYEAIVGETVADYRPPRSLRVVEGNQFFSVPKNAKTERGACIEPTVNVMFQLAIGKYLSRRLKRFGVDLGSQEWNRALASKAEVWDLATIDLSQASDTMSWGLLLEAMPYDWFHLLDIASCRYTEINGQLHELNKFCSMGNGFTFAVETAVFLALIQTFVPHADRCLTAVYGDDIIIPQRDCGAVIDALEYTGFKVNTKKSFLAGSFFESCGQDFYQGVNVRPFFLRQQPDDPIPYALQALNRLREWSFRRTSYVGCDGRFRDLWLSLKGHVPFPWNKCRVPSVLGDTGILSSHREVMRKAREAPDGWEGISVEQVRMVPEVLDKRTFGVLLAHLMPKHDTKGGLFHDLFPDSSCGALKGLEPRRGYLRMVRTGMTHVFNMGQDLAWVI